MLSAVGRSNCLDGINQSRILIARSRAIHPLRHRPPLQHVLFRWLHQCGSSLHVALLPLLEVLRITGIVGGSWRRNDYPYVLYCMQRGGCERPVVVERVRKNLGLFVCGPDCRFTVNAIRLREKVVRS